MQPAKTHINAKKSGQPVPEDCDLRPVYEALSVL